MTFWNKTINIFKITPKKPVVINKSNIENMNLKDLKNEMGKLCLGNAYPVYDKETCGYCAKAVRLVVEKVLDCKLDREESAKDYGPSYEKIGFKKIFDYPLNEKTSYKPEIGDICIIQYNPHGHICMFTGKKWVSDFIQIDQYGGKIRNQDPPFSIYRLTDLGKLS